MNKIIVQLKPIFATVLLATMLFNTNVVPAHANLMENTDDIDAVSLYAKFSSFILRKLLPVYEQDSEKQNPREITVMSTAYSSTSDQTDSDPLIAASGKRVYDGMIAANFLPFGTEVKIPEIFGDKVFVVEDRMHRKYSDRVDIWFSTRKQAVEYGLREVKIQILES